MREGIEGTGLTWIEHWVPRSEDASSTDDYFNCLYSCKYCNRARSHAAIHDNLEGELLNPCDTSWAGHFEIAGCNLVPKKDDKDAERTCEVYNLNDPRKVVLRLERMESLDDSWKTLEEIPKLVSRLLEEAKKTMNKERRMMLLEASRICMKSLRQAEADLERYSAIPRDAPRECKCETPSRLPNFLDEQVTEWERG